MDIYSSYIMENLIEQGISVRRLSELCGINYMVLYDSLLSRSRARPLRIGEYMKIEERLEEAIPLLSEFDKGYILGKVENMAAEAKKN